ncbi:hypothetical protein KEM52_005657 [Ascosphaera acerosa]|nr:hypothetical protein KEM52_005657 [Ascosphaera acerosa]
MGKPAAPLSARLPSLILGSATFNYQFNEDPFAIPSTVIVQKALEHGIRAFDTSPYYGPSEKLLGKALRTDEIRRQYTREDYHILTKVGRVSESCFDYSPEWVRKSVARSLRRLGTEYLDVVYCHDVEFVSPTEVLTAVTELRRIRDTEGLIHYVGIAGYPTDVLCSLAELVLRETGEPLDIVQSYANYTLQNTRLVTHGLQRLLHANVDVVTNASPLGMGLLRSAGVPVGSMGDFHPSPDGLRSAVASACQWLSESGGAGRTIEKEALRFALGAWAIDGRQVGACGPTPYQASPRRLGVSVIGVSSLSELEAELEIWREVIKATADDSTGDGIRAMHLEGVVDRFKSILGDWFDYAWASPGDGFANEANPDHSRAVEDWD